MKTDTQFLHQCNLARFFNFSSKCDPFMVLPSTAKIGKRSGKSKEEYYEKLVVPLDNSLMKGIGASEMVLMGEAVLAHKSPEKILEIENKQQQEIQDGPYIGERSYEQREFNIGKRPVNKYMRDNSVGGTSLKSDVSKSKPGSAPKEFKKVLKNKSYRGEV